MRDRHGGRQNSSNERFATVTLRRAHAARLTEATCWDHQLGWAQSKVPRRCHWRFASQLHLVIDSVRERPVASGSSIHGRGARYRSCACLCLHALRDCCALVQHRGRPLATDRQSVRLPAVAVSGRLCRSEPTDPANRLSHHCKVSMVHVLPPMVKRVIAAC